MGPEGARTHSYSTRAASKAVNAGDLDKRLVDAAATDDDDEHRRRAILKHRMFAQAPPTTIGRFVLEKRLGAGAMGTVYRGRDADLDRAVAIKVLRGSTDERAAKRLLREARGLARLDHPNVVTVYEVGRVNTRPYVAMEYVDGQTLQLWQAGQPFQAVVAAYLDAARGLAAVHSTGLVHRDFKPANVLVGDDGRVRVADFGLVRDEGASNPQSAESVGAEAVATSPLDLTATGAVLGTPAYMSPEQLLGGVADRRSDQFAFCVALYEALSGERPFNGEDTGRLILHVRQGKVAITHLPRRLGHALRRGLSFRPDDRWPDMDALIDALSPRRRRWPVLVALGVLVGAAALALWSPWARPPPSSGAPDDSSSVVIPGPADLDQTRRGLVVAELDPSAPGWESAARDVLSAPVTRRTYRPARAVWRLGFGPEGEPFGETHAREARHLASDEPAPHHWRSLESLDHPTPAQLRVLSGMASSPLDVVAMDDGGLMTLEAGRVTRFTEFGESSIVPVAATDSSFLAPAGAGLIENAGGGVWFKPFDGSPDVRLAEHPTKVTVRRDGLVAVAQPGGVVHVWDGQRTRELTWPGAEIRGLALGPQGKWVVATAPG